MDIKSTKPSKFYAVFSLIMIPVLLVASVVMLSIGNVDVVYDYYVNHQEAVLQDTDYRTLYDDTWGIRTFYSLENEILGLPEDQYTGHYKTYGDDLVYYARNKKTGKVITNIKPYSYQGEMTLAEFDRICHLYRTDLSCYGQYSNGTFVNNGTEYQRFVSQQAEKPGDLLRLDGAYKPVDPEQAENYEIAFAFKDTCVQTKIETKYIYTTQELRRFLAFVIAGLGIAGLACLLFVFRLINRRGRRALAELLAGVLRKIPLEIKLVVGCVLVMFGAETYRFRLFEIAALFFFAWFYLYFLFVDIIVNKLGFWKSSICYWLYKRILRLFGKDPEYDRPGILPRAYRKVRRGARDWKRREYNRQLSLPYQQQLHHALIIYVVGMLGIIVGCFLLFFLIYVFVIPIGLAGMIALSYWFYKRYLDFVEDVGKVSQHIKYLRDGNFEQRLVLAEDSKLAPLSEDLNNLQDGLQNEIEKRMVSEKMKVELITNVSHDLKTPLTSMINYIDLLKEEHLQPDYTNDYVRVLDEKSKRLKSLIENIFDISKASSGNMNIRYEKLNMVELINQTLAECEDYLALSKLSIKKNFTDEKFYVYADGKMLWRVTENMINNAVKYSLPGTRIYLELSVKEQYICFTMKNIAGYEMNFTADSIVERFVRGDESRTTAGTGLGLSIVKSFTEAMGGKMQVDIDGDLFKISVYVKKYQE
ncbi:MAG: histidine kinase dimerization/phospho-acceptor domain-containing protein [Clostridiales bacterium]|nr:histidine kinase dimerization/phospho-acceptor domain-containing protein [Clostridiales bacterium]